MSPEYETWFDTLDDESKEAVLERVILLRIWTESTASLF